jgi:predicted AAA+ superfamily ATPase
VHVREIQLPETSFFLFGPRGTGKTTWLREVLPGALWFDLLDPATYGELSLRPERLASRIRGERPGWVVLDEIQKLPVLLDVVHQFLSSQEVPVRFALTGSSARKLKRGSANLLAGRAVTREMFPLTAAELGASFSLARSVRIGHLPQAQSSADPDDYLLAYVGTYLKEEVQAEALVRRLDVFTRFLQAASFSQASTLNVAAIAQELGIDRKTVLSYFEVLEDLLLAVRVPVFTKRAKRTTVAHPKFYYFDAGVFRTLRPKGPLDSPEEMDGAALETLVLQELRATNANHRLGYELSYWRTKAGDEVDFILYGERGLVAIEVKRSARFRGVDLQGLRRFGEDYSVARRFLFYTGTERHEVDGIHVVPLEQALAGLRELLR